MKTLSRISPETDDRNLRDLGAAIIEQAFSDLRQPVPQVRETKKHRSGDVTRFLQVQRDKRDAEEFLLGNGLERLIGVFGLRVEADAIRRGV